MFIERFLVGDFNFIPAQLFDSLLSRKWALKCSTLLISFFKVKIIQNLIATLLYGTKISGKNYFDYFSSPTHLLKNQKVIISWNRDFWVPMSTWKQVTNPILTNGRFLPARWLTYFNSADILLLLLLMFCCLCLFQSKINPKEPL